MKIDGGRGSGEQQENRRKTHEDAVVTNASLPQTS
jgi:hypothetical protein